jgi:hypothetical protein
MFDLTPSSILPFPHPKNDNISWSLLLLYVFHYHRVLEWYTRKSLILWTTHTYTYKQNIGFKSIESIRWERKERKKGTINLLWNEQTEFEKGRRWQKISFPFNSLLLIVVDTMLLELLRGNINDCYWTLTALLPKGEWLDCIAATFKCTKGLRKWTGEREYKDCFSCPLLFVSFLLCMCLAM